MSVGVGALSSPPSSLLSLSIAEGSRGPLSPGMPLLLNGGCDFAPGPQLSVLSCPCRPISAAPFDLH